MRISDWSSDVCSSDLTRSPSSPAVPAASASAPQYSMQLLETTCHCWSRSCQTSVQCPFASNGCSYIQPLPRYAELTTPTSARENGAWGKSGSVLVSTGGRRILKKKKKTKNT